jgi:hypothetical protein
MRIICIFQIEPNRNGRRHSIPLTSKLIQFEHNTFDLVTVYDSISIWYDSPGSDIHRRDSYTVKPPFTHSSIYVLSIYVLQYSFFFNILLYIRTQIRFTYFVLHTQIRYTYFEYIEHQSTYFELKYIYQIWVRIESNTIFPVLQCFLSFCFQ